MGGLITCYIPTILICRHDFFLQLLLLYIFYISLDPYVSIVMHDFIVDYLFV